jgi:transporter family protein
MCSDSRLRNEVLLALFGMVCVGVADVLRRRGLISGGSPVTYMALETAFIALFSFVAMLVLEGRPNVNKDVAMFSPVTGLLVFAGILALLIALSTGEASRYAPITRLGFVVTFLLAVFVFGESLTFTKAVGVALAAGAVVLLSLDI